MDSPVKKIHVNLGKSGYSITVGSSLLSNINSSLDELNPDRVHFIISSKVFKLYQDELQSLSKKKGNEDIVLMNDGEKYKSYQFAEPFFNTLLEKQLSRKSAIVAVGGGVVGDFAGFLAAMYMRGIALIHVPTTLLAMVDSSIGGKVAVNISAGKNIVGAFHQPKMVFSDISFLKSLPDSEMKNGIAETVKHALIGDAELMDILLSNDLSSIKNDETLERLVYLSAKFKTTVVEQDEKEGGLRAILNFGHTVGHAIESLLKFKNISHGEAVAIGMKVEMEMSRSMGWLNGGDISLYNEMLKRYDLISSTSKLDPDGLLEHMMYDKKNAEGKINFVLLKGIGKPVYNQNVDESIIRAALKI